MERVYKRNGILFKVLPCILITMFVFMCFSSNVFATSTGSFTNSDGITVNYTTNDVFDTEYYFMAYAYITGGVTFVYYYISYVPFILDGYYLTYAGAHGYDHFSPYSYDVTVDWSSLSIENYSLSATPHKWKIPDCTSGRLVYSNHDITDSSGNVVFQVAPQEETQEELETMLTSTMKSVDFSQVMTELLGILPIVLLTLILLIALMKAIRLLFRVLRQA